MRVRDDGRGDDIVERECPCCRRRVRRAEMPESEDTVAAR